MKHYNCVRLFPAITHPQLSICRIRFDKRESAQKAALWDRLKYTNVFTQLMNKGKKREPKVRAAKE